MNVRREPDMEPNMIVNVHQKRYVLNGRLVRPALVEVSDG
jgi:molecular chaperone GrpE (heat shock protein)